MTSKSCTKSYNRKLNSSITSCSIQFDKIFRESNNRPSAAKSAGTVGKWGITSFTSIRSTNINDRRSSDFRNTHGTKRLKLDYVNQNLCEKDIVQHNLDKDVKSDCNKPKKFFKSRNVSTISGQSRSTPISCRSIDQPLSIQEDKKYTSNELSSENDKDNIIESSVEVSCREEAKPPIVLRICKGTAKLISSEESDAESYRISTTSPISKSNMEHDSSNNIISDNKSDNVMQNKSRFSLQPNLKPDMRTTRSRSKNVRYNSSSNKILTNDLDNPGLSLTLRKSIADSENTLISHYDIVKTENPSYSNDKNFKNLVSLDQSLPSTTQELLDILSKDIEKIKSNNVVESNYSTNKKKCKLVEYSSESNIEPCTKTLDVNVQCNIKNVQEKNINLAQEHSRSEKPKIILSSLNKDVGDTIKNLDQEWSSSSEDSESANSTVHSAPQNKSQCLQTSNSETLIATSNKMVNKPAIIKKGSIFKTRSTGTASSNKRRALYKHKWSDSDKELKSINISNDKNIAINDSNSIPANLNLMEYDAELKDSQLTRVTTYSEDEINSMNEVESAITSIRCDKKVKGFYTVVKNVKKAHQIQESGEFQEFNDDVDYIMDTLRENNPNATRCLSAIRLASKCMAPAFRMHVRAHGTVAKFFKALHDATTDQSLALCTATVMFVLSQDRLAMDLDRDCLELMLSLLESDASHKNALDDCGLSHTELLKNKEKVRQLCADIQAQGHANHLNLDNITVGQLAMETLLSLTSKRAGEWFKEELRELGGLEHIIKTITECHRHINLVNICDNYWNESLLDKLRKVDRCLRVLENVTHMNEENQIYLLKYNNCILVITLASLYDLCGKEISKYPTNDCSDKSSIGAVIRECLFAIIKVLINLTHHFNKESFGGQTVGRQNGVIENSLHLILQVPQSLPEEKRFDIMMLALILLINMIEQCEDNKKLLVTSAVFANDKEQENGLDALIYLFYKQEELARLEEQKTDAILDGKKDSEQTETISTTSKSQEEFIEETVAKLLQKAGRHMEHTLIGAYVVLLLGYLIMDDKEYEKIVRQKLPNNTFLTMIAVLQKFFNFMNLTASNEISSCGIAATEKVIMFLKMSDAQLLEEDVDLNLIPKNIDTSLDNNSC